MFFNAYFTYSKTERGKKWMCVWQSAFSGLGIVDQLSELTFASLKKKHFAEHLCVQTYISFKHIHKLFRSFILNNIRFLMAMP